MLYGYYDSAAGANLGFSRKGEEDAGGERQNRSDRGLRG